MKTIFFIFLGLITIHLNDGHKGKIVSEKQSKLAMDISNDDRCKYIFTSNWEKVEVEVRSGKQYNCGEKDFVDSFILYKNESKVLYADDQLCYRRKARPSDPNSNWANWTSSVMCAFDRDIKVDVR